MTKQLKVFASALTALMSASIHNVAHAVNIRTAPGDYVFVNSANPGKNYNDVMVQTVILCNDGVAPVTLTALQIDLLGEGANIVTKAIPVSRIIGQTREFAGMAAQGMGVFLNAQLLTEGGPEAACGQSASLSASETLAPGDAVVSTSQYLAADFEPVQIIITATIENAEGKQETAQLALKAQRRDQPFEYDAPLKGPWLMRAFPNVASHHRFIPSNEFAFDFFRTGPDGAMDQGDKNTASDDYGHSEPVYAVADGEVIFVIDDQIQDQAALSRRAGESIEDARRRITQYQMRRFTENFRAAAAGNLITVKHKKNGHVEYSSYAHLKHGSIVVGVGDRVKRGDMIAAIGNTGDSTLTHLHFQLNAGPDAFHSRSLPISFSNGRQRYVGQDPGLFMIFGD